MCRRWRRESNGERDLISRMPGPILLLAGACMAAPVTAPARAQALAPPTVLDVADTATKASLQRVPRLLADGQLDDGVELLRRVMESDGAALIAAPGSAPDVGSGFVRYVAVREYCQSRLAHWAQENPQGLSLYRNQVNPVAERLYQQGREAGGEQALRQVVDQYFVSHTSDDALYRLGELALERGDFTLARSAWERISPVLRTPEAPDIEVNGPPGLPLYLALRGLDLDRIWSSLGPRLEATQGSPNWLAYPDTDLDLAAVRARLVLASILEGSGARAAIELEVMRRLHPQSEGQLAGRRGKWVELLGKMLDDSHSWPAVSDASASGAWAGSASGGDQHAEIDIGRRPIWQVELPRISADGELFGRQRPRVAETESELLSYHPLVADGLAFVSDGRHVRGFDVQTGAAAFSGKPGPSAGLESGVLYDHETVEKVELGPNQGTAGVARFTLTARKHQLFARLGSPVTAPASFRAIRKPQRGMIVGLDVRAQGRLLPGFPLAPPDALMAFEGTPVCDDKQLHVGMRHAGDGQVQAAVASFDLRTGKLSHPITRLCGAETPGGREHDERTHNRLTLEQGVIYYNTNLGAVAAVAADDGRIRWLTTYPRATWSDPNSGSAEAHWFRDLNPCLLYRDLLIVAPGDCEYLFCLDAPTGQVVWASAPGVAADAIHLLGVVGDRLIVSGDYLYWLDVWTGRLVGQFPAVGDTESLGYGRGLIAGNVVYWPTRDAIHVLDAAGMQPTRQEINLSEMETQGGNLCLADSVLLIAGPDRLTAFNQFGRPSVSRADRRSADPPTRTP